MASNRSIVSPLRIDAVDVPAAGGLIGIVCPRKDIYAGLGIPAKTMEAKAGLGTPGDPVTGGCSC